LSNNDKCNERKESACYEKYQCAKLSKSAKNVKVSLKKAPKEAFICFKWIVTTWQKPASIIAFIVSFNSLQVFAA
jgi:hypothetical protein